MAQGPAYKAREKEFNRGGNLVGAKRFYRDNIISPKQLRGMGTFWATIVPGTVTTKSGGGEMWLEMRIVPVVLIEKIDGREIKTDPRWENMKTEPHERTEQHRR